MPDTNVSSPLWPPPGGLAILETGRDQPEFPRDALLKALLDGGHPPEEAKILLKEYEDLKLTLPISEEGVRRLCQVMSNHGLTTIDSCHGHPGREHYQLPSIFFLCSDLEKVADLVHVIHKASSGKHFHWEIIIHDTGGMLNPKSPLYFQLIPVPSPERPVDPVQDREKILFDLEYIGLCLQSSLKRWSSQE